MQGWVMRAPFAYITIVPDAVVLTLFKTYLNETQRFDWASCGMQSSAFNVAYLLLLSLALLMASPVYPIAVLPSPDVCGWPSLREGGRFGPSTVRLAQRLLSKTLGKPIPVDGIFSVELIADIKAFQGAHSLNVTGVLNSDVWPTLVSLCSPLEQVT